MSAAIMHRKPLPARAPLQHAPAASSYSNYSDPLAQSHPTQYANVQDLSSSHRTPSMVGAPPSYNMPPQQQAAYGQPARRTLSNATSISSTSTNTGLQQASSSANVPRRSTSSRSTSSASPTSYVALMRKQKATVWCDRAQHEDPRILAAQRAAKTRAAMEVAGGQKHASPAGRTSTSSSSMVGGVRSKIRHHGAPKASTYNAANLTGAGVPMRLSATEVDEGDSDEEPGSHYASRYHSRNGSGRSSLGSGHRGHQSYMHSSAGGPRGYSNGSTPPSGHSPVEGMGDLVEEETPVPNQYGAQSQDYFDQPGGQGGSGGSSGEREESFGGIGGLPPTASSSAAAAAARSGRAAGSDRKTSEELRRRGSVDDRTMTMSGVRLFVANPDLSD